MVSPWNISDNKSQIFCTLLSILANINKAVMCMVSSRPFISKFSSPCTTPLMTVPKASITIAITVMFNSFFQLPSKVEVFIFLFAVFQFYSVFCRDSKVHNSASSFFFFFFFFLLTITTSGRLAENTRSVCISKSQSILCVSFPRTNSVLCVW